MVYHNDDSILILGRALHAPWNEGTRVIGRDVARAARLLRPAHALSLTHESFRGQPGDDPRVEHVYTRLPYGARGDYAALGRIARAARPILESRRVVAAHLVGLPLALAPWLRRRGLPVVAHVPLAQQAYRGPVERLRAALGWRCFDHSIGVYACSCEYVREQLAARGYPAAKLRVVPSPLDVGRLRRVERAAARHTLGLPADGFVVAYLGTISPLRFPAGEVLEALALAADSIPGLRMAVFAPVRTHPYNASWAEQHLRCAIEGSSIPVSMQLRDLDDQQKIALYSAADVVLLPFTALVAVEPPLTLIEAMACEALVAVAPNANRSRLVADGANGVTFSSPEQLAARLTQLYELGVHYRAALGAAARATILERHSFDAAARSLDAIWRTLDA